MYRMVHGLVLEYSMLAGSSCCALDTNAPLCGSANMMMCCWCSSAFSLPARHHRDGPGSFIMCPLCVNVVCHACCSKEICDRDGPGSFTMCPLCVNVVCHACCSKEICDRDGPGSFIMCPLCDKRCPYWRLWSNCLYSRLTYIFENYATALFAAFMAVWC